MLQNTELSPVPIELDVVTFIGDKRYDYDNLTFKCYLIGQVTSRIVKWDIRQKMRFDVRMSVRPRSVRTS